MACDPTNLRAAPCRTCRNGFPRFCKKLDNAPCFDCYRAIPHHCQAALAARETEKETAAAAKKAAEEAATKKTKKAAVAVEKKAEEEAEATAVKETFEEVKAAEEVVEKAAAVKETKDQSQSVPEKRMAAASDSRMIVKKKDVLIANEKNELVVDVAADTFKVKQQSDFDTISKSVDIDGTAPDTAIVKVEEEATAGKRRPLPLYIIAAAAAKKRVEQETDAAKEEATAAKRKAIEDAAEERAIKAAAVRKTAEEVIEKAAAVKQTKEKKAEAEATTATKRMPLPLYIIAADAALKKINAKEAPEPAESLEVKEEKAKQDKIKTKDDDMFAHVFDGAQNVESLGVILAKAAIPNTSPTADNNSDVKVVEANRKSGEAIHQIKHELKEKYFDENIKIKLEENEKHSDEKCKDKHQIESLKHKEKSTVTNKKRDDKILKQKEKADNLLVDKKSELKVSKKQIKIVESKLTSSDQDTSMKRKQLEKKLIDANKALIEHTEHQKTADMKAQVYEKGVEFYIDLLQPNQLVIERKGIGVGALFDLYTRQRTRSGRAPRPAFVIPDHPKDIMVGADHNVCRGASRRSIVKKYTELVEEIDRDDCQRFKFEFADSPAQQVLSNKYREEEHGMCISLEERALEILELYKNIYDQFDQGGTAIMIKQLIASSECLVQKVSIYFGGRSNSEVDSQGNEELTSSDRKPIMKPSQSSVDRVIASVNLYG